MGSDQASDYRTQYGPEPERSSAPVREYEPPPEHVEYPAPEFDLQAKREAAGAGIEDPIAARSRTTKDDTLPGQSQDTAPAAEDRAPAVAAPSGPVPRGLLKGLVFTAIAVVAVMALVGGFMASSGALSVAFGGGFLPVTTFEAGAAEGIGMAINFLTSGLGLATLGLGAAGGAVREYRNEKAAQAAAPDSEEHCKLLAVTRELEQEKALNQQLMASQAPEQQQQQQKQDDGIYIKDSVIEGRNFRAAELKRRVERPAMEARAV